MLCDKDIMTCLEVKVGEQVIVTRVGSYKEHIKTVTSVSMTTFKVNGIIQSFGRYSKESIGGQIKYTVRKATTDEIEELKKQTADRNKMKKRLKKWQIM